MKRYLLLLMFTLLPTLLMAQVAGGAIKRPVKKQQTASTTKPTTKKQTATPKPTQKTATKPKQGTTAKPTTQSAQQQQGQTLSPVLQTLINNMVRVEGGTFTMGATTEQGRDALDSEKPAHEVTLSSFSIGKYEVTQKEWETVMGNNPSYYKSSDRPVEQVTWEDCQTFIRKLNQLTGKRFRLPTEAEWEYAARGGNRSKGCKYAGNNKLRLVAWYDKRGGDGAHPVGQLLPNELGLYDMSGNVDEWCQDWYAPYTSSPQTNPTGPSSGSDRVERGGCWVDRARECRSSSRRRIVPKHNSCFLGLRLAL